MDLMSLENRPIGVPSLEWERQAFVPLPRDQRHPAGAVPRGGWLGPSSTGRKYQAWHVSKIGSFEIRECADTWRGVHRMRIEHVRREGRSCGGAGAGEDQVEGRARHRVASHQVAGDEGQVRPFLAMQLGEHVGAEGCVDVEAGDVPAGATRGRSAALPHPGRSRRRGSAFPRRPGIGEHRPSRRLPCFACRRSR